MMTKFKGRTYEKVCSTTLFSEESNITCTLKFYKQSSLKVEKKKIDKTALLNRPSLSYVSKLNKADDLYRLCKIKVEINRAIREKQNRYNQRFFDLYDHDVPALYKFVDNLYNLQKDDKGLSLKEIANRINEKVKI